MDILKLTIKDRDEARAILGDLLGTKKSPTELYFSGFEDVNKRLVRKVVIQRVNGVQDIEFPGDDAPYGFALFSNEDLANDAIRKGGINLYSKGKTHRIIFKAKRRTNEDSTKTWKKKVNPEKKEKIVKPEKKEKIVKPNLTEQSGTSISTASSAAFEKELTKTSEMLTKATVSEAEDEAMDSR